MQIIIQVQTQMSKDGPSSSNILSKPEHILSFIKHAIQNDMMQDTVPEQASTGPSPHQGLTLDDLRIVPEGEQDDDADMEGDSDDEAPGLPGARANDEMTITALNLLLSILEGTLFCLQALFNILLTVPISKSDTLLAVSSHSGSNSRGC